MHFSVIFRYLQTSFAVTSSSVDQVLNKILQIDHKLTFNIFHILKQGRISKMEKISNDTDPLPPKKGLFLGALKAKNLGYISDRIEKIMNLDLSIDI